MNRNARWLALVPLSLLGSACTDRIDVPGLETRVAQDLRSQYETAFSVSCPDDIEVGKGKNFECTARAEDGTTLTLRMTQVDDRASVTYEIVEG